MSDQLKIVSLIEMGNHDQVFLGDGMCLVGSEDPIHTIDDVRPDGEKSRLAMYMV